MTIENVKKIIQLRFSQEVKTLDEYLNEKLVLKVRYGNIYVAIIPLNQCDYFEITFFKSHRCKDDLFNDFIDNGITFLPKTEEELLTIINNSNV